MKKTIFTIVIIISLYACSDSSEQAQKQANKKMQKKEMLLQSYKDDIQKAKDMQKKIDVAAKKQRKIIDG